MLRFATLLLLSAAAMWAQSTGAASLVGTVSDTSGAVIPGAKIAVRNLGTQFLYESQTNADGSYYVPNLPSGSYDLTVEGQGFKRFVQSGLILRISESPRIDVRLEVGNVTESVKVDATPPLLETESASSGQVLDGEVVEKLPRVET